MKRTIKWKIPELQNGNGRVYSEETFDNAIKAYEKAIAHKKALGELGHPESDVVSLNNVSHIVEDIKLEYDRAPRKLKKRLKKEGRWEKWRSERCCVVTKIRLLTTPKGNIAKALFESGLDIPIGMRGVGKVQPNGTVEELSIISFDLVNKKA